MYTREQASKLRQEFWTTFGQYMAPVLAAEGLPVNWVNYKTGLKRVYFRMKADKKYAEIAIEISHPDAGLQELFFEQFLENKVYLESVLEEDWTWELHGTDEFGKTISRIYKTLSPVSIFNKDDWPALISFFKPRIIALDAFWNDARYSFDELK